MRFQHRNGQRQFGYDTAYVFVPWSDSSESVSAYFGANYIANHNNTTIDISVVETSAFSILHYGGNRYGGNPNRINRYIGTGAKSSTGYADNILDYATQGVENDILFGGSETYSARRTSVFWPTNAGLLLNACPGHDTTLAYTLGVGAQDMRGFERQGYDAERSARRGLSGDVQRPGSVRDVRAVPASG